MLPTLSNLQKTNKKSLFSLLHVWKKLVPDWYNNWGLLVEFSLFQMNETHLN